MNKRKDKNNEFENNKEEKTNQEEIQQEEVKQEELSKESTEQKTESNEKKPKERFYKKFWWSITKIKKYEDMSKEGLKGAIKYFLMLITTLTIILAIAESCIQIQANNTIPFLNYLLVYFINYILILFLTFGFETLVISLIGFVAAKILKIQIKYKELLTNTIYATTLAFVVYVAYMIFHYFTKISIPYFDIIDMIIAYVYTLLVLDKRKNIIYK